MTLVGGFHLGNEAAAKQLVMTYHYSHRWPTAYHTIGTWHEPGGLFGDAGEPVAACVFTNPPPAWPESVVELSRLVRRDDATVPLSRLISITAKWAHRRGADLLISYADATHGHHGGIYQAASWNYAGQRKPSVDGFTINGQFIPNWSVTDLYGTKSVGLLRARGIEAEPHYDHGKHLYWRSFARSGKAKAERLNLQVMPYPKPDAIKERAVA